MGQNPKISVIMAVYNEEEYVQDSISTILAQTYENFELIIVDDDSTDDTVDIIQSIDDERICLINNENNRGLAASLNRAADRAKGKYLARMDADDRSLPNRFQRQVRALQDCPERIVVGCWTRLIDENGKEIGTWEFDIERKDNPKSFKRNWDGPTHPSVMIRKEAFNSVNGYREQFRFAQDIDLWMRMAKEFGDQFLYIIPEVLFEYRLAPSNFRSEPGQEYCVNYCGVPEKELKEVDLYQIASKKADVDQLFFRSRYHLYVSNNLFQSNNIRRGFQHGLKGALLRISYWITMAPRHFN